MWNKSDIRRRYLELRRALSHQDAAEKSARIRERLQDLKEFQQAEVVLSYISSKDNEVDTQVLIETLLASEKDVLVPFTGANRTLAWSPIRALSELAPATFGILEPRADCQRVMEPPAGAVVLVPGIAFARDGYRVGYGGGYFDRFLADFAGLKIGLAYDFQIVDSLPHAAHDVPVDIIVTESHIHRCMGTRKRCV